MSHLFSLPIVLMQHIFTYLDLKDLVPTRSLCKFSCAHSFNKLCWGNRFNFFQLVLKSTTEFDWNNVNPNVIEINTRYNGHGPYPYSDYDIERIEKILITMPINFPNLLCIDLGGFSRLPVRTFEHLAKNKKLMFVGIFSGYFTDELIEPNNYLFGDKEDKLEKFVSECKSLITIDTDCPYFGPHIDGYPVSHIRNDDDFRDLLDGKKIINEIVVDYGDSEIDCSNSINARKYPNIRSWNSSKFDLKLIKNFELFKELN